MEEMTQRRWDQRYAKKGFAYGEDPNVFLSSAASLLFSQPLQCPSEVEQKKKPTAISLGEGEGRNTLLLSRLGFETTAVDISPVGLAKTRRRAEAEGFRVKILRKDVKNVDFGERKWDLIVSIFCALDEKDRQAVYQRCISGLRPGGILILEGFAEAQLSNKLSNDGPKDLDRLLTPDKLASCLPGMILLRCESLVRPLNEGKYHTGESAVVQCIAMQPSRPDLDRYMSRLEEFLNAGAVQPENLCSTPEDKLLAVSSKLNQLTLEVCKSPDVDRCKCCWSPRKSCFCNAMLSDSPALEFPFLHFTVLCHPLEFMRSTSSGKLVSFLLGGHFMVYSTTNRLHERLQTVLQDPETVLLYPTKESMVTEELEPPSSTRPRHVVVLDGTWAQTKALLRVCLAMNPKLRTVELSPHVKDHFSPLVDAVHPGFGGKRITTLEACWMFMQETLQQCGLSLDNSLEQTALQPMISMITKERNIHHLHDSSTSRRAPKRVDDQALNSWATALRAHAATLPGSTVAPAAATFCNVCGVTMSAPQRMLGHVTGKRHCLTVARRFLDTAEDRSVSNPTDIRDVFDRYSTAVMSASAVAVEPPDVAFMQVFGETD